MFKALNEDKGGGSRRHEIIRDNSLVMENEARKHEWAGAVCVKVSRPLQLDTMQLDKRKKRKISLLPAITTSPFTAWAVRKTQIVILKKR